MAEPKKQDKNANQKGNQQQQKPQKEKQEKTQAPRVRPGEVSENEESLVRILGYDIPGSKNLYSGFTRIKGVSWALSNATLLKLNLPRNKKIGELTKDEIKMIETFLKNAEILTFLKNRRSDPETGETKHFVGTDLEMKRDFDIRRMKKIRSYKGVRHTAGQPVRGQRTKSHFRTRGKAVGVQRKKSA